VIPNIPSALIQVLNGYLGFSVFVLGLGCPGISLVPLSTWVATTAIQHTQVLQRGKPSLIVFQTTFSSSSSSSSS